MSEGEGAAVGELGLSGMKVGMVAGAGVHAPTTILNGAAQPWLAAVELPKLVQLVATGNART